MLEIKRLNVRILQDTLRGQGARTGVTYMPREVLKQYEESIKNGDPIRE